MSFPSLNLTKDDYQNLVNLLETVEIKGRKSAEYIAVLGVKLENRVANWFDKHPTGFDIIEVAKTSEAFEALVKEGVAKALAERDIGKVEPIRAGYEQET